MLLSYQKLLKGKNMVPEIELKHENIKFSETLRQIRKRNHEIHPNIKRIILSYQPPTKKERNEILNKWNELDPPISRRFKFIFSPSFGESVGKKDCEIWFKPSSSGGRSRLYYRSIDKSEFENGLGL
ncbi:hypothetical protein JWG44_05605 [Leptospira sp. 201903071]|uniref:hypothetical protein n=1 Tax=Leptospira ainazelensis TaxID=2810034 RepID=UPI00196301CC|nr:hypothetical protein [Leptospira ainazelensis]MBM9499725.1 hypothetical protein [Leptospira ainazelensis]